MDSSDDSIFEIMKIEVISSNLIGLECKGLYHTVDGESEWIQFHQNRLGRYGYEPLGLDKYQCEYLVSRIMLLSRDTDQEILEIRDIQKLRQSDDELVCSGTVKTPSLESVIEFYSEENEENDGRTYGYELVAAN